MSVNNSNYTKEKLKFPYEIKDLDPETNAELLQYFKAERTGFVQVGPSKYFFPIKYKEAAEHFYNFEAKSDDIWIVTFPRSGTTWTQELLWLIANDLDFDHAKREPLTKRFPFFEFSNFINDETKKEILEDNKDDPKKQEFIEIISQPGYKILAEMKERRFIKTHFPFSLLPPSVMEKKCKVIYVARNPKDVAVSYYHLNRLYRTQNYVGDFERYWDYFERGLNAWMPYWSHIKEGLDNKHHQNVLFMLYEEMIIDFPKTIAQVSKFLGKELTEVQIENLTNYLNIDNFKMNDAVNGKEMKDAKVLNSNEAGFVRNGNITGWQSEYTLKLKERAEAWINKNLSEIEIKFPTL